jgi:aryl sulfotransferase
MVVRYEDLAADPIGKFTEIAAHLRLPATADAIAEAADLSTFDKLAAAERVHPFKETSERADYFFREGRVGAWRDRLTAEQAARIVSAHGTQMARFGYVDD